MKTIVFLIISMTLLGARAQSTFKPIAGKFKVLSVSTDCSYSNPALCIAEGDIVMISSTDSEAVLSVFEKSIAEVKLQILMKEYSWQDEGNFGYAKFEKNGNEISWSEASNGYSQHITIQPKENIYILEGKVGFSKFTPSFADYYKLVLHPF